MTPNLLCSGWKPDPDHEATLTQTLGIGIDLDPALAALLEQALAHRSQTCRPRACRTAARPAVPPSPRTAARRRTAARGPGRCCR